MDDINSSLYWYQYVLISAIAKFRSVLLCSWVKSNYEYDYDMDDCSLIEYLLADDGSQIKGTLLCKFN